MKALSSFGASYPSSGTAAAVQDLTKGCTTPSRIVSIHVANSASAGSGVYSVSMNNAAVYTPSVDGPLTHFDYSESNASIVGHQATGPALLQNGNFYVDTQPHPLTVDTTSCGALSLVEISSDEMCRLLPSGSNPSTYGPYTDCTQHPDFSGTGAQMTFGFFRGNSAPGGGYDTSAIMDNWDINLCGTAP